MINVEQFSPSATFFLLRHVGRFGWKEDDGRRTQADEQSLLAPIVPIELKYMTLT